MSGWWQIDQNIKEKKCVSVLVATEGREQFYLGSKLNQEINSTHTSFGACESKMLKKNTHTKKNPALTSNLAFLKFWTFPSFRLRAILMTNLKKML